MTARRYAVLLLPVLVGCGPDGIPPADDPRAGPVEETAVHGAEAAPALVAADTVTVELPLALPAQLYVEHDAVVHARSAGVVESIHVDLGDRVTAGQLLARLESTDQEIALATATEALADARRTLERERALGAIGGVTKADEERVEYEYRRAELALRQARRNYELTRVVAPFDGVISGRNVRAGRLVAEGDSLFRVTELAPVLAAVRVPDSATAGVRVGATAEVVAPDGATVAAKVIRVSPVIDAASGTREAVVRLAPGSGLAPGTTVSVRLGTLRRRVVTLPRAAVDPAGYALVWSGGRTSVRPVTLGADLRDGRVEIAEGLAAGERVVATGR